MRNDKAALQAQCKLLEDFVVLADSVAESELLKSMLQNALDVASELTGAEKGSLFLLDQDGAVTDSILTRGDATPETAARLIGTVMDKGLAGWVFRYRRPGLIIDTQTDDRWVSLPNQPYTVRSALAVPIQRAGWVMGLLTLLHSQPGHFDQECLELMQASSAQIALVLENTRLYATLEESHHRLEQAKQRAEDYSQALAEEMEKGRKIQRDFLPDHIPMIHGWEVSAHFHPAWQVSGDFYDAFQLPGQGLILILADVSGKGVGAALFMALMRSLLRVYAHQAADEAFKDLAAPRQAGEETDPRDAPPGALSAVRQVNDYILENHAQEGMFVTLFFGVLDPVLGRLSYINAGHEPFYIVDPAGHRTRLDRTGPAVGLIPDLDYRIEQVYLKPGDILIGYTDGVTEAQSASGEFFTRQRLETLLTRSAVSGAALLELVKKSLMAHLDQAPPSDDITMLALFRRPN